MKLFFIIKEAPEGGLTAESVNESIFTEGDDLSSLKTNIREAVSCHFGDKKNIPKIIRLHFVKEEVIAV